VTKIISEFLTVGLLGHKDQHTANYKQMTQCHSAQQHTPTNQKTQCHLANAKARLQSSKHTGAKQNLTQNGHSRSLVLESVER